MSDSREHDMEVSKEAFKKTVIPTMRDEEFYDTEGGREDFEELTDWITDTGLRYEHKHCAGALRGNFVMRALRHNGQPTDLQKFAGLILRNSSILQDLAFTRSFGNLDTLGPGDYDLVEAGHVVSFLQAAAEEVFGYEGAIRELKTPEGTEQFLKSGAVDTHSVSNATFIKIPFEDLALEE